MKLSQTPAPFEPVLKIDDQTQIALQFLAKPFIGKTRMPRLCKAVKALLSEKFKSRAIDVTDATSTLDRNAKILNLLVLVDGKPDQGLVFGFRKPDGTIYGLAAND